ncbi:MAG: ABC transporter ATP-binding protein/permease [Clostridia bacterium]|nr:ABC transporter ATP-binding protein/permease [Clostridia bacterium]
MLQLKSIRKDYRSSSETVQALKGVDLSFRKKEFVSILGPSGCGKTTLLNIIGGLDHYTSGDLVISGRSTKSYRDRDWDVYRNHRIGFIFQSYNLIPHQTVIGNVELALTIAGVSKKERFIRAKRALDRVGLKGKYYKRPNQLSGGQCQRVAIARALVNDPEILLADEPTGALDTATSVQIMDLIREISGERLVIMVTHNPELAEQYSSRIIRLLDGKVQSDTNPFSPEEEEAECRATAEEEAHNRFNRKKRERAKMSGLTTFRLSARNLISKRGRTAMVGIAGSIGIIGIALVLAFSAGIKGYVASMQDDMLSGNPITIEETTLDFSALSDMMNEEQKEEILKQPNRVYINSMVEYLARMDKNVNSMIVKNELTADYLNFVKAMPKDYYAAMTFGYGTDMTFNIFTDFEEEKGGAPRSLTINALTSLYTNVLKETEFKDYAAYVSTLAPSFKQAPNNKDYIASQYNLLSGKFAEEADEVMLVVSKDDELSDLLLARLGFYAQDEFLEIVNKATKNDAFNEGLYRDSFSYDELLGKQFLWLPNDTVFSLVDVENPITHTMVTSIQYNYDASSLDKTDGILLKVVGILQADEEVSFGCLSSGIYYTEALTNKILENGKDSEIVEFLNDTARSAAIRAGMYQISYDIDYTYKGEAKVGKGTLGPTVSMSDLAGGSGFGSMMGGGGGGGSPLNYDSLKDRFVRSVGGNDLASNIAIYPKSFDSKDQVTDYLDKWNGSDEISVNGTAIAESDRAEVKYADTLELIINMINTMIDVVSYALIAFTSVSLVVSTVMIGIITYVSVVERIKEIGVIRALGGRKRDVSNLFIAETFIIGLLSGAIGIGVTYLISEIVNMILHPIIHIRRIASLPPMQALLLVGLSIVLTLISGLIPARSAAKKDPVVALRTE